MSCLVFDLRCRKLQEHDEKVATSKSRAVLDYLSQIVCDKSDHIMQLVFLVCSTHDLLEILALLSSRRS